MTRERVEIAGVTVNVGKLRENKRRDSRFLGREITDRVRVLGEKRGNRRAECRRDYPTGLETIATDRNR